MDPADKIKLKNNWSQTQWEVHDKEVQVRSFVSNIPSILIVIHVEVLPSDLDDPGDGDEWPGWRKKGLLSVNTATQVR